MRILAFIAIVLILSGCASAKLGEGGLYVNKDTCVGMDDFGVAKMKRQF